MEFVKKLTAKNDDKYGKAPVTIAFLGDSVTQGCFELYEIPGGFDTVYDPKNGYPHKVWEIFQTMAPGAQINLIAGGIGGDSAPSGASRLERDILPFKPDLTVVCYALNDCGQGEEKLGVYTDALHSIFTRLKENGSEVVFMTPNTMCTRISGQLNFELFRNIAASFVNSGEKLDMYVNAAIETARKDGVPVCDCYRLWKDMVKYGVDTTELLSNKLNHPIREFHYLFAWELVHTILENA